MGRTVGTTTVRVTAAAISQNVQFTATAVLRSAPVSIADANLRVKIGSPQETTGCNGYSRGYAEIGDTYGEQRKHL